MKSVKAKNPAPFKRDGPDLPANLDRIEFLNVEPVTIQDALLQDVQRTDLKLEGFRIEGSVLERVQLAEGRFGSAVWKDVRLIGCDLANIHAHRISLVRVELIDCRLTGFRATSLDWQDVLIRNGDLRYSQFQAGKFRNCEFDTCDFQDADLQESDLSGSMFRSSNLSRADLRKARLQNTDFRTSEVDGVLVEMNDLRGAIVDPVQAMIFARVLGLQIL